MFEVCAKCGHVGRGRYVDKVFAVFASNAREAARIARDIPRVKHHKKDAITYVVEVDEIRFQEIIEQNVNDSYFACHSIQEQRSSCDLNNVVDERYKYDSYYMDDDYTESNRQYFSGKNKIRKPHKYHKYYHNYSYDEYMVA